MRSRPISVQVAPPDAWATSVRPREPSLHISFAPWRQPSQGKAHSPLGLAHRTDCALSSAIEDSTAPHLQSFSLYREQHWFMMNPARYAEMLQYGRAQSPAGNSGHAKTHDAGHPFRWQRNATSTFARPHYLKYEFFISSQCINFGSQRSSGKQLVGSVAKWTRLTTLFTIEDDDCNILLREKEFGQLH